MLCILGESGLICLVVVYILYSITPQSNFFTEVMVLKIEEKKYFIAVTDTNKPWIYQFALKTPFFNGYERKKSIASSRIFYQFFFFCRFDTYFASTLNNLRWKKNIDNYFFLCYMYMEKGCQKVSLNIKIYIQPFFYSILPKKWQFNIYFHVYKNISLLLPVLLKCL